MSGARAPVDRVVHGGGDQDLLLSLPRPVLQIILGLVESRPVDLAPSKWSPNQLLPLRLVSKGLRAAVDETLSFLTVTLIGEQRGLVPMSPWAYLSSVQHREELSLIFTRGLPRWTQLTHLGLTNVYGGELFLELVFSLLRSSCPNLQGLSIKHRDEIETGTWMEEREALSLRDLSSLTALKQLSLQVRDRQLEDVSALTSLAHLKLYDVVGGCEIQGPHPRLESLVLERDNMEGRQAARDATISLELGETALRSLAVRSHPLQRLTMPKELTSLSLVRVSMLSATPVLFAELPNLLELRLNNSFLQHGSFHIPTGLTSLNLRQNRRCHPLLAPSPIDILPSMTRLRQLTLGGFLDMERLPDFRGLSDLMSVKLVDLGGLTCIQALSDLSSLRSLHVQYCLITCLPRLCDLRNLSSLHLEALIALTEDVDLNSVTSLEELLLLDVKHVPLGDSLVRLRRISYMPRPGINSLHLPTLPCLHEVNVYGVGPWFEVHGVQVAVLRRHCEVRRNLLDIPGASE